MKTMYLFLNFKLFTHFSGKTSFQTGFLVELWLVESFISAPMIISWKFLHILKAYFFHQISQHSLIWCQVYVLHLPILKANFLASVANILPNFMKHSQHYSIIYYNNLITLSLISHLNALTHSAPKWPTIQIYLNIWLNSMIFL